jgi:hypothetical protein
MVKSLPSPFGHVSISPPFVFSVHESVANFQALALTSP